jgi:RNA polymerase sigma factor (sigma-70 family)
VRRERCTEEARMIARQSDTFRSLLRVASEPDHGDLPDAELLRQFVSEDDRAAFAALVRRYGPLVHGLCARVLNHRQDAEDAAQATFLVLSTKASTLAPGTALAGWLYGVAHRTALKLRVGNARRRVRERSASVRVASDPPAELSVREAQAIIDEELDGLPDRLRAPLVLGALDGLTRVEAARRLGWTLAAVKDRLEQARARLRTRLTRRGLALPAGGLSLLLLGDGATAAVPAGFTDSTVRAAERLAVGPPTPDPLSPGVRSLLDGGLRPMTLTKLNTALVGLVLVIGLAAGGAFSVPGTATGSAPPVESKAVPAPPDPREKNAAELQGTWTLVETHTRG